ncbi:follicle cell protein 3C-1-like [Anabrus simplex]|uniref:follicle cell protein 3C-1-like n=1 Tax=Anabrus simplex TaxID=316456 RepID=UPI0035A3140C
MASLVVILLISLLLQVPRTVICKSGECHCAIYKQGMSVVEQWPLITVTPLIRVPCDSKGKRGCREVCIDMANQTWLKTSSFMCGMLKGDTDSMELAVFFKSCFNNDWESTGITTTTSFCCRIGRPTEC